MKLALVVSARPHPRPPLVRYEGNETLCELCGPSGSHKRALFMDRRRKRRVCAKCMVRVMDRREARES